MSGRSQAANLTGMLSQLASDVGEMGKAYDWTHNAIRTLSMPELDENDPKSLAVYAEWARRNGREDVAAHYSKLAADLAKENAKMAYAKGVAQNKERMRGLLSNVDTLEATPIGNNELYGTGGQLPVQAQINNAKSEIDTAVSQGNALGESSRYGTGVEGSTSLREVNAERTQALKDAIALRMSGVQLSVEEQKLNEPVFKRLYSSEATRLQGEIGSLIRTPSRTEEQEQALAEKVKELDDLSAEYSHLDGINIGAGTKFRNEAVDQYNQEVTTNLNQRAAANGLENEQAIRSGYEMADRLAGQNIYDVSADQLSSLDGRTSKALTDRLAEHKTRHEELLTAQAEGTVSAEDLAYAETFDTPEFKAAVAAYKKPGDQHVLSRKPAAVRLKKLVNAKRAEQSTAQEKQVRETAINSWGDLVTKADVTQVFGQDLADIFQNTESREKVVAKLDQALVALGRTNFRDAEEFVEFATVAASNAGLMPQDSDQTKATTTDLIEKYKRLDQLEDALVSSVMDKYESGGSNLPQEARLKNAQTYSNKAVSALRQFERRSRSDQLWLLNNESVIANTLKASGIYDVVKSTLEGQEEPFTINQLRVVNDGE